MAIYVDNAATTPLSPKVVEAMAPFWEKFYGNASSAHADGNRARVALEDARKKISKQIGGEEGDLFFTSGGTEANNWAIQGTLQRKIFDQLIVSPIAHQSILSPARYITHLLGIDLVYLPLMPSGMIDWAKVPPLFEKGKKSMVSLMHGHNELGFLNDIEKMGKLCQKYGALFHVDLVQSIPYIPLNLAKLPIDLAILSAHKFHGPKGVGALYVRKGIPLLPLIYGGKQEREMRGGTENIAAIVGMSVALKEAIEEQKKRTQKIRKLKNKLYQGLKALDPRFKALGTLEEKKSLCSILSLATTPDYNPETLLFNLSIHGISASSGSACMSGTEKRSHVLVALNIPPQQGVVRFSLSHYNSQKEMEAILEVMGTMAKK